MIFQSLIQQRDETFDDVGIKHECRIDMVESTETDTLATGQSHPKRGHRLGRMLF